MTATLYVVGGTGEKPTVRLPHGLLSDTTRRVGTRFTIQWIDYPAAYGIGFSYANSVHHAKAQLRERILATTEPFAIIGYSQGADIAGRVAQELGSGALDGRERLLAVGLVANPMRHETAESTGWGVAGQHGSYGAVARKVYDFANPDDMITNADPDSLIRDVADLTRMMGPDFSAWAFDIQRLLKERSWQNLWLAKRWWDAPYQRDRVRRAGLELAGYLPVSILNPAGGQHTAYGKTQMYVGGPTYTERLAQLLTETVNT